MHYPWCGHISPLWANEREAKTSSRGSTLNRNRLCDTPVFSELRWHLCGVSGAVGRAHRPVKAPLPTSRAHLGVASLKEIVLSSRFSRSFFSVCRSPGRTFYTEATGFFLNVFVMTSVQSFRARATNSWVDRSRSIHRVRLQSFLSSRLHPNSSLRVSASLTGSAQAAWSQAA